MKKINDDQIQELKELGVKPTNINHNMSYEEADQLIKYWKWMKGGKEDGNK